MADTPSDTFNWRAPTRDDAPAIAGLIRACQAADGDAPDMTIDDLTDDWRELDLAEEAILVSTPDGRPIGYADLLNRRHQQISVYSYVHPDHRQAGVGDALAEWGEAWARERLHLAPPEARVTVQQFVRSTNEPAQATLVARGYAPVRAYYWMQIFLDSPPPAPAWPAGIVVRPFDASRDGWALYEAGEDAFQDIWGRLPSTEERWLAPTVEPDFDASLWFMAEDVSQKQIAAFALCKAVAGRGNVATLGVRRAWRRRGLGLALLHEAFGEFYRRGLPEVGLSVDAASLTGAPRLYHRAGMHVDRSYILYRREIRPGADLSASANPT